MSSIIRTWRVWAIVVCLVALACLAAPLFPFAPKPSDVAAAVAKAPDLDAYLRQREAQITHVRPDLVKTIIWNDPVARNKTPLALVYLHGFSASRRDTSPVLETLAGKLAANAFATRLTAHGRTTAAGFATVTAQDWLDDAREALAIGRRIGDRVVLIGISTGALLATMAALEDNSPDIAALVLLSPNFAVRDWRAKFVAAIKQRFDDIRSPAKLLVDLPGATRHELTGDALAPETVGPVVERIAAFLAAHAAAGPARSEQRR